MIENIMKVVNPIDTAKNGTPYKKNGTLYRKNGTHIFHHTLIFLVPEYPAKSL
jgi:hypothetical protein